MQGEADHENLYHTQVAKTTGPAHMNDRPRGHHKGYEETKTTKGIARKDLQTPAPLRAPRAFVFFRIEEGGEDERHMSLPWRRQAVERIDFVHGLLEGVGGGAGAVLSAKRTL